MALLVLSRCHQLFGFASHSRGDPLITNDVLYQLSYTGILLSHRSYYGPTRTSTRCLTHWLHARIASGPAHYKGPALPDESY